MSRFLNSEKVHQAKFKSSSPYFSAAAREDGVYMSKARPFCLPLEYAEENLFHGIRETALAYFRSRGIRWHDGYNGRPSNHLCDSQVCCLNFLFPLASEPVALAEVLRRVFPAIRKMLPMEGGQYLACEWIGRDNYLGERIPQNGKRTRGANCTSADAAVMFERSDGRREIVLIEWKYTESYGGASLKISKSGTDRTVIYRALYERDDCPVDKHLLPSFDSLFYEPFYQFMRQQFLAHEMERARELDADIVTILHIAPSANTDFRNVTSPELKPLGETAVGIWKRLVGSRNRFISISTEQLFGCLSASDYVGAQQWLDYVHLRYPGILGGCAAQTCNDRGLAGADSDEFKRVR
jgi:hypothetical protein